MVVKTVNFETVVYFCKMIKNIKKILQWIWEQINPKPWTRTVNGDRRSYVETTMAGGGATRQSDGGCGHGQEASPAGLRQLNDRARGVDRRGLERGNQGSKKDEPPAKKRKGLRCTVCSDDHFTNNYPLLHGPKPHATFCGLAGDGLGFLHIPTEGMIKSTTPLERVMTTALIRIMEGDVSAELLKSELARILPVSSSG
jgi:hypothetical protein